MRARDLALRGALAGNPRCMQVHGNYCVADSEASGGSGSPRFIEGRDWMEKAASQGEVNAMFQCGILYRHSGNRAQALYWLEKAERAGDADAREYITRYGLE